MTKIYDSVAQVWGSLPTAAWDLQSFLENAKNYVQEAGGGLLMAMGAVGLCWGGFLSIRKLMSPAQGAQATSWATIIGLILVGGALGTGGWTLVQKVGSGGQDTIEDLGEGAIVTSVNSFESITASTQWDAVEVDLPR